MDVKLSEHFTFKKIFLITISPILMMLFTSIYGVVDGYFISNYAGISAYAGVNLIMPVVMVIGGIGFMFGTGGSALSSKLLGEKNRERANQVFTMIIKLTFIVGLTVSILGAIFIRPICEAMGRVTIDSTDLMVEEAIRYGRIVAIGQVFFMIQVTFHSYFMVDEKPKLGFRYTIISGVTNMILDFLLIKVLGLGTIGAALGTICGYVVGSVLPMIHFLKNKDGNICLTNARIEAKPMLQACFNGSSEFVNNISSSIVGLAFNIQLLRYFGEHGISAHGTIMYVSFIFVAIFIGYSIGMAPVVGFNFGAQNKEELKNVLKKSLIIIGTVSVLMFIAGEVLGPVFSKLFVGSDEELLSLTVREFRIYSFMFLCCGFSIYLSSFFTALNNGLISALISFLRTLVFQMIFLFTLPLIVGSVGVWYSIIVCEVASLILSFSFLIANKNKYGYL